MQKLLIILRGVSGSGKSTVSELFDGWICEADSYHYDSEGNYNWKAENQYYAHKYCQEQVLVGMGFGLSPIIVSNTSTTEKEMKPYLALAEEHGYNVISLIVENRHGNKDIHDVPEETLQRQERNLRNSIKLR